MAKTQNMVFDVAVTALVPVVWGSTYLVTTEFLPPGNPLLASVLRALPAGLILVLVGRTLPKGEWWWRSALLGILNIGAFFYCLFVAAYHLPGGVAALLTSIQPVIVLLYGFFLSRTKIEPVKIIACICAVVGIALVALRPEAKLNAVGVIAGLAGAFSMATGIFLTKRWGRPENATLLTFTGWQLAFGGLALLPFAMIGETMPQTLTLRNIAGFSYLGLIGALVSYALWFRGIERLPALSVSFIALLSPLSATLLGWWFLGQALSALQILGGFIVLASVYLSQAQISIFKKGEK